MELLRFRGETAEAALAAACWALEPDVLLCLVSAVEADVSMVNKPAELEAPPKMLEVGGLERLDRPLGLVAGAELPPNTLPFAGGLNKPEGGD
jgi:hypothetical protein